jgi:hypothetical protein
MSQTTFRGFLGREEDGTVAPRFPLFWGEPHVLLKDAFGPVVIEGGGICNGFHLAGICRHRRRDGCAVQGERCVCASMASFRAEIGDDRDGAARQTDRSVF